MARKSIGPHLPPAVHRQVVELGEMIAIARKERGWTQHELADRIGVARMTVVRLEQGSPELSIGTALSAAWLLELPVLGWTESTGGTGGSAMATLLGSLHRSVGERARRT